MNDPTQPPEIYRPSPPVDPATGFPEQPPGDGADRVTWGLITGVLDVLEKHGYHQGDNQHVGRAIGMLGDLARIYAGEQDTAS